MIIIIWKLFFRIADRIRKQKDDFARVVPYLIADILKCFQTVTIYPQVKYNLTFAIYKLLDICDQHSIGFLVSNLDEANREMFKHVMDNYKKYYKYSGAV